MEASKEHRWRYHAPKNDETIELHQLVRGQCRDLAEFLDSLPAGREKSLAETKLEEVMFWANAAIARA